MLRWTTSYRLYRNSDRSEKVGPICSTVIFDNIWTAFTHETVKNGRKVVNTELTYFNTTTHDIIEFDCGIPETSDFSICNLTSHANQLYIFWSKEERRHWTYKIYKIDTVSGNCNEMLTFDAQLVFGYPQIMKDTMYCLNLDKSNNHLSLIKIDLSTNTVETHFLLVKPPGSVYQKLIRDDKLYLLEYCHRKRVISLVDDQYQLQHINTTDYKDVRYTRRIYDDQNQLQHQSTIDRNDAKYTLKTKWFDNNLVSFWEMGQDTSMMLGTFDFEEKKWMSDVIEKIQENTHLYNLQTAERVGDNIYVVIGELEPTGVTYDIRILPLKPTLVDACLVQLVDEILVDRIKLESISEIMPNRLKQLLSNMLEYRKPERFAVPAPILATTRDDLTPEVRYPSFNSTMTPQTVIMNHFQPQRRILNHSEIPARRVSKLNQFREFLRPRFLE